jgi:hypothetical protein
MSVQCVCTVFAELYHVSRVGWGGVDKEDSSGGEDRLDLSANRMAVETMQHRDCRPHAS